MLETADYARQAPRYPYCFLFQLVGTDHYLFFIDDNVDVFQCSAEIYILNLMKIKYINILFFCQPASKINQIL